MSYIPSKERARVIRKSLAEVFGSQNVSVKKGRGTASSWVEAHVHAERPTTCTCEFSTTYWNGTIAEKPYRAKPYCESCKSEYGKAEEVARRLSREAMEKAGYEHSTYTSDDGYGSERSEFLMQVSVK